MNDVRPNWGINVTRLTNRALRGFLPTGIERVVVAYLEHALSQGGFGYWQDRHGLTRLTQKQSHAIADLAISHWRHSPERTHTRRVASWWQRARVTHRLGLARDRLGSGEAALHVSHGGMEQHAQIERVLRYGARMVTFVHDLIPLRFPEYCCAGEMERHALRIEHACRFSRGLIVNSQTTRYDLEVYAAEAELTLPPVVVAPLGTTVAPVQTDALPQSKPYFVVLGTIEPRKNHWLLLHCWRELVTRLGDQTPHLYVVGRRGWECENIVDLLERCEGIRPYVHELGNTSDAQLAGLVRGAQAMLFPSFSEGYGLPLSEALALGTPVIASDLPVFREIAQEIPDYLNPLDGPGWLRMIEAYTATDSPERIAQLERIREFKPFTWDQHFQIVDEFIREVCA